MPKKIDVSGLDHYHDKVSAMLASEYSSSKTYAVGDYCFHAGTLYECTTAITTAEAWTSGHWTAAKLAEDTSALKTALNEQTEAFEDIAESEAASTLIAEKVAGTETLPEGFTTGLGYLRGMSLSNPGNLAGTSSDGNRWFSVQANTDLDVYVDYTSGSFRNICVFNNASYGESNRATPVYQSNNDTYPLPTEENPLHVSAGQYITLSWYNATVKTLSAATFKLYAVTAGDYSLKSTTPLTDKMEEQVDGKIDNIVNDIMQDGYFLLDPSKFARGGWDGYDTADSRSFRVRYKEPLEFDHDVYVLAEEGFNVAGYYETSGSFSTTTIKKIPANTKTEIYVRRITEDETETADVDTFASKIKFSTALAPIELYRPTFTDISMFERVGVGGDSYASSGGKISGKRNLSWGKNLERQAGITVDIYAKSGQSIIQWMTDNTNGLPAILSGTECGLYLFQHGINGTGGAMTPEELGTSADMSANPHPQTFYGQYVEAIEQIHETFPNARIILLSIVGTSYGLSQTTYAPVNQAIQDIAEYCGDMWIDITKDDFLRSGAYSGNMLSNHPTAMVNAGIAMAYRRLIARCILDNPEYFRLYGSDDDDGGHPTT